MRLWERYFTPHTVEEAVDLLSRHAGSARVVAGGTDLLLEIRQGHRPVQEALVDVTCIEALKQITLEDDTVHIGAGVTHSEIVRTDYLASRATCLVESCGVVGGPQVRNVATLGGNVAHALPAADGTTSLVALNAEVEFIKEGKRQWAPMLDMFKGPGQSLVDSTRDLLLGFRFELCGEREATAFKRIMRPQGVALPVLAAAVWVQLAEDLATLEDLRICIGPVAPVPTRITSVEESLRGQSLDDGMDEAIATARENLNPRTSKYRATAQYRIEMVEILLRRALTLAVERARTGEATPEGVGLQ